ncbi:MAG: M48 family metallopeptidase [Halanaerobiales bacterium]|nr:M48 family metallopeptidase [Halanaerobiales bacterium]
MKIDYKIIYSKRKTLNISVERDRKVIVRAPEGLSEERIEEIVQSKKQWIKEKVNHAQKYPNVSDLKEFVSGETLMYLGRNYQLLVVDHEIDGVEFNQRFLISRSNQKDANTFLKKWYKERAIQMIKPKAERYARNLGVEYNEVKISEMRYRWASCITKNNINFNWRIIKAPMYVLDYLIVHELVHLIEPNHTPEFWNILSIQVPNYIKAKKWLKENGHLLEVDF